MDDYRCDNCGYYRKHNDRAECRRYPPVAKDEYDSYFPRVFDAWYCGEWTLPQAYMITT